MELLLPPAEEMNARLKGSLLKNFARDLARVTLERDELRDALERSQLEILFRLAKAAEFKDSDTSAHIYRVGALAALLAERAGLPEEFCRRMAHAAPMHDLGKIGIPDAILRKPGPLTEAEWDVMRTHPSIGAELLSGSGIPLLDLAAEVALSHHEKYDGSGYPAGLRGETIPMSGRIVAVVDYFDALTMDRCYRQALPVGEVLSMMREIAGAHLDPALVDLVRRYSDDFVECKRLVDFEFGEGLVGGAGR